MRTVFVAGLPADWKALKSCVPRRCWAASCMAATSRHLQTQISIEEGPARWMVSLFLPISSLTLSEEPSIHFVQTQAADQARGSLWPDGIGRFWRWLHGEHGSHWALGRPSVRCGKQIRGMSLPTCPHSTREISHSPPSCPEYNVFLDLSLPS